MHAEPATPSGAAEPSLDAPTWAPAAPAPGPLPRWLPWIALALTILAVGGLRLRFLDLPIDRDEGEFAYGGQLILDGEPPYRSLYAMKMPGIYAVYAVIEAAFGQTRAGIHLGLLVANALTIIGAFLLARRLFDPLCGALAGVAYGLLSLSPSVDALAAQSEHFVVLFVIWGMLALSVGLDRGRPGWFALAGVLLGVAPTIKQHGTVFLLAAGAWLLLDQVWRRREPFTRWAPRAVVLGVALCVPMAGVFLTMYATGVYEQFRHWTLDYASKYVGLVPAGERLENFHVNIEYQLRFWGISLLWVTAVVGLTATAWDPRARGRAELLIPWTVASLVGVTLGFYFRTHYFVLLLPVMAVLAALGLRAIGERLTAPGRAAAALRVIAAMAIVTAVLGLLALAGNRSLRFFESEYRIATWSVALSLVGLTALILQGLVRGGAPSASTITKATLALAGLVLLWPAVEMGRYYLPLSLAELSRKTYYRNPFVESIEIARKLAEYSEPGDAIGLLCSEPQILFYAKRRSASGHIYMYPLMELHDYAGTMQQQLIADLERVKPKYIVYSNQYVTWVPIRGKSIGDVFTWWTDYQKHYEVIGTVDMQYDEPVIRWKEDFDRISVHPAREMIVIYRRIDGE